MGFNSAFKGLNDREDIMAKWKNYTMKNFVMVLREFNYAVAARFGRSFGPVVRQSTKRMSGSYFVYAESQLVGKVILAIL